MAWIESHQSLRDHPKTRKLARILNVSVPTAVGHLHCLWWWAMDYSDDGDVSQYDELDIAIGGGWDDDAAEFVDALVTVGFLDQCDEQTFVHDWEDYGGKLTRRRKENAERMREARARSESRTNTPRAAHVQRTDRTRVGLQDSTQEDTREEDKQESISGANAPTPPPSPEPVEPPKPKKRASRIPEDFAITDRDREWARERGASPLSIERETEKFVNYWTAESGAKASKLDWHAAWKVWMGRNLPDTPRNNLTRIQAPARYPSERVGRDGLTDAERGWRENPGHKGWSADELMRMANAMEQQERERNSA